MRKAIVSYYNHPFAMLLLKRCLEEGITIDYLLFQGDTIRLKDKYLFQERTPHAPQISIADIKCKLPPIILFDDVNSEEAVAQLNKLNLDIILQGGGPILKSAFFSVPSQGILNSHPGILPHYRGCCAVEWAVFNDDELGCTTHFLEETIDSGPIVDISKLKVKIGDSYEIVRTNMLFLQIETLINSVRKLEKGFSIDEATPQLEGRYWKVPSEKVLKEVRSKLKHNKYRYQSECN